MRKAQFLLDRAIWILVSIEIASLYDMIFDNLFSAVYILLQPALDLRC